MRSLYFLNIVSPHVTMILTSEAGLLCRQVELDEEDVDDRFRGLFGQLAGGVSCCWSRYLRTCCLTFTWRSVSPPQDCEISAFELQKILNKVVTKRKTEPQTRLVSVDSEMSVRVFVSDRRWHPDQRLQHHNVSQHGQPAGCILPPQKVNG